MSDNDRPVMLEISKGVNDNNFSMDELFYRFFHEMPLFYFQSGGSDLVWAACDDEIQATPHKGPDELKKTLDRFIAHLKASELPHINTDWKEQVRIAKYTSFDGNVFAAYIILHGHKIITKIRVTPGSTETLTAVSVLAADENKAWEVVTNFAKEFIKPPVERTDMINIITQSNGDFYLKEIPLKNPDRQDFSYDHYEEGFEEVSESIIKSLQIENGSGLYLFHGDPGTGKTTYLKYLLHTISTKKLIYLPPDLIEHLSAPNFVAFMMSEAANSILLIEDAENVLRHRQAGGNQAVSNILNISDGILGDVLRLQIVCTFNSELDEIDQALLRPGRLVAEYRFLKLNAVRAAKLMRKIHGPDVEFERGEMTLADIFNFEKMPTKSKWKKKTIGFT